jgi:hypothetical protein
MLLNLSRLLLISSFGSCLGIMNRKRTIRKGRSFGYAYIKHLYHSSRQRCNHDWRKSKVITLNRAVWYTALKKVKTDKKYFVYVIQWSPIESENGGVLQVALQSFKISHLVTNWCTRPPSDDLRRRRCRFSTRLALFPTHERISKSYSCRCRYRGCRRCHRSAWPR